MTFARERIWTMGAGIAVGILMMVLLVAQPAVGAEPLVYSSSFGPDGTEATDFGRVGSVAVDQQTHVVYVIDREAGSLYKFDADGQPVDFTGSAAYISGNQIGGLTFFPNPGESQVAVDSQSHVVYVTSGNSIVAFQPDGEPANFSAGPGAGTNQITGFSELLGVAVDVNGNVYASDYAGPVRIYAPTGELITQFEAAQAANVAVATDGSVYVNRWRSSVLEFTPSEFPVTAATTYEAATEPLDENVSFSVAVDPITGDVYVAERYPDDFSFSRVAHFDSAGAFIEYFGGPGEEGQLADGIAGVAVTGATGKVYVGSDSELGDTYSKVSIFSPEVIPVSAPTIGSTSAIEVSSDSAVLRAQINPNTLETTYRFEYGLAPCSQAASACTVTPPLGASAGAGHEEVNVSRSISGLQSNTTYYYRVVAENSLGVTEGPDRSFTTQVDDLNVALIDSRVWEMVSPANKLGGVLVRRSGGIIQAATSGNGIAFQSFGSIEATPEGNRAVELSTVLATRGDAGWSNTDITPPHTKATPLANGGEYNLFSPELSKALLEPHDGTLLSPQASERAPYLRENTQPPTYTPLVTGKEGYANVPPGTVFGGDELQEMVSEASISGASPDLSHVVLRSAVPLAEGAAANSLYEWAAGQLRPVSVLPADEGGAMVGGVLGSDQGTVRHAVSEDGSRVFWSPGNIGVSGINLTALYMRDTLAEVTVRLDGAEGDASGSGAARPAFQGASADGSVVYFTDSRQLTADASPGGRDLYRCEIAAAPAAPGCASLTNLSAPLPGSGESGDVQGLVSAISEDGSKVYFVASGVLDTSVNGAGESAVPGEPNLYLWEQGERQFVVTLSPDDDPDWGKVAGETPGYERLLVAATSPSGRFFVFMSERDLTGYDNRDAVSGERVEEVFAFDSATGRLTCVSCAASGASPSGRKQPPAGNGTQSADPQDLWAERWVAATLPEPTASGGSLVSLYPLYRPRAVLDNGRVFFNAVDSLVSADSNGNWDVYQYEPFGVGGCSASGNAAVSILTDGCVGLISSGTGEREATFLDASVSGNDVFFLTPAQLSVQDVDTLDDVYDARVGGVRAQRTPPIACSGEDCRATGAPPGATNPISSVFQGKGDPRTAKKRRCPKGKHRVRRGGRTRCVPRKHRHRRGVNRAGNGGKQGVR